MRSEKFINCFCPHTQCNFVKSPATVHFDSIRPILLCAALLHGLPYIEVASCNNNKVFPNFTLFSVQAFSKAEVTAAKQLKEQLESFQARSDAAWKGTRWIEDAVQKGRNQATVSSASSLLPVKVLRDVTRINLPGGLRGSKFYPSPLLSLSLSLPPGFFSFLPLYSCPLLSLRSITRTKFRLS